MKFKSFIIFVLIGLLVSIINSCSEKKCRECPVCPEDPEPENYRLYSSNSYNKLYSIDIPADTVIDSINIDFYGGYLFVTPGGKRLLVSHFDYDSGISQTEIYNTSDLSHIGSINQYGNYYFDGGDNYGILQTDKKTYFINSVNLSPIDSIDFNLPESILVIHGYLDTTADLYFVRTSPYLHSDTSSIIYKIDCSTRTLKDSTIIPMSMGRIISIAYNWFTNDIYFHALRLDGNFFFQQYDLDGDSLISSTDITQATGSISVSPDGRHVYMTDGGHSMFGYYPIYPIWIFDALTNQPTHWIPPYDSEGNYISPFFGQIIPTPDNLNLYICGNTMGKPIIKIDLQTNRIDKILVTDDIYGSSVMALGPVPIN